MLLSFRFLFAAHRRITRPKGVLATRFLWKLLSQSGSNHLASNVGGTPPETVVPSIPVHANPAKHPRTPVNAACLDGSARIDQ
jgi:hypothetical protein